MEYNFPKKCNSLQQTDRELVNVSSPEMFDSETESDVENEHNCTLANADTLKADSPQKPSQTELIAKADNYLLARIHKSLSGIPPPPRCTRFQSNCSELLESIRKNYNFLWSCTSSSHDASSKCEEITKATKQTTMEVINRNTSKNLTNACDESVNIDSPQLGENNNSSNSDILNKQCNVPEITRNPSNLTEQTQFLSNVNNVNDCSQAESPFLYQTVDEAKAATLTWPEAFSHKSHGIHYNRSKAVEEFENLTIKLCERYIEAETKSTCNIWFSKQTSPKKRSLLAKCESGLSPEKRLTHLARRRKTFSSANLQGLGLADKRKQVVLEVKKPICKKGKSPKGKSPRGKSPRNSATKRVARRLMLDGTSPCKSKLETSKRALFQSPPLLDGHAGPSKLLNISNADTLKIKRILFPASQRKEIESENIKQTLLEQNRKRKREEELQGLRVQLTKSLSFDCTHELTNTPKVSWDRYSSGSILLKNDTPFNRGRNDFSDKHRKKLLWAVAETLRSKGIGMSHPQFKHYASKLARTVKKFMPDLENKNIPRKPGSTSDRMLKLAKHHILFLLNTKPTD